MSSTYTDLGIELMVTGANDGTWGTKTNTNFFHITSTSNATTGGVSGGGDNCSVGPVTLEVIN